MKQRVVVSAEEALSWCDLGTLLQKGIRVGECLEWPGPFFKSGYGSFEVSRYPKRKTFRVHRLVICLVKGYIIPDDIEVLHDCDNKRCYDLFHLYMGDH